MQDSQCQESEHGSDAFFALTAILARPIGTAHPDVLEGRIPPGYQPRLVESGQGETVMSDLEGAAAIIRLDQRM